MSHILRTSTEHKTASLADEGNSAYYQSSGAHNSKLRGHLPTIVCHRCVAALQGPPTPRNWEAIALHFFPMYCIIKMKNLLELVC